jgi:hypothetical protein
MEQGWGAEVEGSAGPGRFLVVGREEQGAPWLGARLLELHRCHGSRENDIALPCTHRSMGRRRPWMLRPLRKGSQGEGGRAYGGHAPVLACGYISRSRVEDARRCFGTLGKKGALQGQHAG